MQKVHTDSIYFDHASSTPVHPEVLKSLTELSPIHYANSESLHEAGLTIQTMMRKSREAIATMLSVNSNDLYFTSGATESNNILVKGIAFAYQKKGKHLITTSVEHSSLLDSFLDLESFFGFDVTFLPVNQEGRINPEDLRKALRPDTTLVSIMAVNNEIGTIMPIKECAKIVHENSNAIFHVDAVQALTKIDLDLSYIDCASFSAHKINGVKGSGLLYKKNHVECHPIITGGQQEHGLRPGTPNAINHILLAKTMRLAFENHVNNEHIVKEIKAYLVSEISRMENVVINSPSDLCSNYILNISCLTVPSQVMLSWLNQHKIYVSAMATCLNRDIHPSHVLSAMGIDGDRLNGVLRISIGYTNTMEQAHKLISVLKEGIRIHGRD
ncbi:MAG TPA: cysteine desulfurase family protein [Erysipelotrichaceae bacterium]|nr:cysteine desulfurase family protein [Erysipelotrichaceae bacterium]